jgi:PKD repeat protein
MTEVTKAKITGILNLDVGTKVKAETATKDAQLVTAISFIYEGLPGRLDEILASAYAGHQIDVEFSCSQLPLLTFKATKKEGQAPLTE